MNMEDKKRIELRVKYENWIKRNKLRLSMAAIFYFIIVIFNLLILKNERITILSSLLIFTYTVYVYSLVWFINKKLLTKINKIDFKTRKSDK